jgi:hypothetical protein
VLLLLLPLLVTIAAGGSPLDRPGENRYERGQVDSIAVRASLPSLSELLLHNGWAFPLAFSVQTFAAPLIGRADWSFPCLPAWEKGTMESSSSSRRRRRREKEETFATSTADRPLIYALPWRRAILLELCVCVCVYV